MKCSICNRELQPGDELKWECSSCHQFCRANLQMLEQIQTQRENGYTAAMVNCPFCGTVLDDGNERIHWDCLACGNRTTGTVKNYVRPELIVEETEQEPEQKDSANQSEFAWFDSNGEAMDAPPEEPPKKEKSFFANEEEKNEFLAETKSQALGEEIPDSIFEDAFPIRKPKETPTESAGQTTPTAASAGTAPSGASQATAASAGAASSGASQSTAASAGAAPSGVSQSTASTTSPFIEPPTEPTKPVASPLPPTTTPSGASQSTAASAGAAPSGVSQATAASTGAAPSGVSQATAASTGAAPSGVSQATAASARTASSGRAASGTVSSASRVSTGGGSGSLSDNPPGSSGSSGLGSSTPDFSRYEPQVPASKQVLPKILTGILGVVIVAAVIVGVFFVVNFFMAPTRQFRSAVKAADYTKALEIYDNKIKGNTDKERVAEIAVEHYLHERYDAFKNGTGDEAAYQQILEFAKNEMRMDTSDYEGDTEPVETPEPTDTPEPTESPAVEVTEEPSETPEVTEAPEEATPEPTPEETVAPEVTPEPTPEPTPDEGTQPAGSDEEITAALQKATKYVRKNKFEKAYNHLSKYKNADTTGQIAKEMSSIKKEWKSYNIKTFKSLCGKLTIVYYASEKRYHIVPKGYYTNYNQISRSNNVGGIAYMDQNKKKVSITNIGKDNALSSFGKTNRANLKQFKEMIEKYPYLAGEIK